MNDEGIGQNDMRARDRSAFWGILNVASSLVPEAICQSSLKNCSGTSEKRDKQFEAYHTLFAWLIRHIFHA